MRKHKKRYRSKGQRERSKRRAEKFQKNLVNFKADKQHVQSFAFLDRGGNGKRIRLTMKREAVQSSLRDGTLHLKGKQVSEATSKVAYKQASRTNPVLPVTYVLHGIPTKQKARNTRKSGHKFKFQNGTWYTTKKLNSLVASGILEAEEAYAMLAKVREGIKRLLPKFADSPAMMSMDHWPAWKVTESMADCPLIERFKLA
jgi:hypothetical protein